MAGTTKLRSTVYVALVCFFLVEYLHQLLFIDLKKYVDAQHRGSVNSVSGLPAWILPFAGEQFKAYRAQIDKRIEMYQEELENGPRGKNVCKIKMYTGEFGYEIGAVVPHIYDTSLRCPVVTRGLEGTTYLYWFSKNHSIFKGRQRNAQTLPRGNPFGQTLHRPPSRFPTSNWTMPDYKTYFWRDDVHFDKPLFIIFNKFTPESHLNGTINFIPIPILREILKYLVPKYHVVYNRLERKELLEGADSKNNSFRDKEIIRQEFPRDVVILDDLVNDLDPEGTNLMIFSLGALCKHFISVQGGNSLVASFFGGKNIILAKKGKELRHGDFGYYFRYANTTVTVVRNENDLLAKVKQEM
jgi:hypothetical protein